MHVPVVELRSPDGRVLPLTPGAILGRAANAAFRLSDPRISEAHAMVSLRGRELRLLALRGSLILDGNAETEIPLEAGQRIFLAGEVAVEVIRVMLPTRVLALRIQGGPPRELCAEVYSLVLHPEMDLVPRYVPGAAAFVCSAAEGWTIEFQGTKPEPVQAGGSWTVGNQVLAAEWMPIAAAGAPETLGRDRAPSLTLIVRYTTVHVHRRGREPAVVDGLPARILSELALMGCPCEWQAVAQEIWKDEDDPTHLRRSWDRALRRLRIKLREEGIRDNLVRCDGLGNHELYLFPGDEVRDET